MTAYSYETFKDANGFQRVRVTRLEDNRTISFTGDPDLPGSTDIAFNFADKYQGRGEVIGNTQSERDWYWNE